MQTTAACSTKESQATEFEFLTLASSQALSAGTISAQTAGLSWDSRQAMKKPESSHWTD